jgi:hypothetical protein
MGGLAKSAMIMPTLIKKLSCVESPFYRTAERLSDPSNSNIRKIIQEIESLHSCNF